MTFNKWYEEQICLCASYYSVAYFNSDNGAQSNLKAMQIDLIPFIPILIKSNVDEFLNDCTAQHWEEMNWRELKRVLSDTCACIQAWQCAAGLGWVLSVFQSPAAAAHQPQLSQLHWSLHTPAREHFHIPSKNSSSNKCYIHRHKSLQIHHPSTNLEQPQANP